MLEGIKNTLNFINDNWTMIVINIGLALALYKKVKSYVALSTDEKINTAKNLVAKTILKRISDAEDEYKEWVEAGKIKRSKVIKDIFDDYPILSKVTNQDELIEWIDNEINTALADLREIVKKTAEAKVDTPVPTVVIQADKIEVAKTV